MAYEIKNFDNLIGIKGLSENILKNHFTLYQGYVANFNKLNDTLVKMEKEGNFSSPEFAELNRRFAWEFNGMRLHELYFENMTKNFNDLSKNSELFKAIAKEWGSLENWKNDFISMGKMRGIGWIILYYDPDGKRLFNVWINEHDTGHFAGGIPLLVMDVFEHAYIIDYELKRADYIDSFFKAIDWNAVSKRFENT